ncbi:MAG: 50S ribosomal protein L10 [Myxococcales bacterium]|nr:50S ribosomal protein L10 [Myxococcales bacterium]
MLTRAQKEEEVATLRDKFERAATVIVADYRGLSVEDVNVLRVKLREAGEGYEYRVAKNTLLRRAVDGTGAAELRQHFEGPTAVAFSFSDPVGIAKALVGYSKDHQALEIRGGIVDGKPVDTGEIATLATLPGLDELRGKLVGLVQAPAQQLASLVQAPGGQLARLIAARQAQLEEGGA